MPRRVIVGLAIWPMVKSFGGYLCSKIMDPTSDQHRGLPQEPVGYRSIPELIRQLERATPGMVTLDLFSAHDRGSIDKLFEIIQEGYRRNFADDRSVDSTKFDFKQLDVRVARDNELARASHEFEVAIVFSVKTPDGRYIYSPGFQGSPTQTFENPVLHIPGQTLNGNAIVKCAFTPAAFDELLDNVEDCAGSGQGWPSAVAVQMHKAIAVEFRGGLQAPHLGKPEGPILEGIVFDHGDDECPRWIFETNEGTLVVRPRLDRFGDFELVPFKEQ